MKPSSLARAVLIPLNDASFIEENGSEDPDAFDSPDCSIYAISDSDNDVICMIEDEHCFRSNDGTHVYLDEGRYCHACGAAHPSIRKNGCGQW